MIALQHAQRSVGIRILPVFAIFRVIPARNRSLEIGFTVPLKGSCALFLRKSLESPAFFRCHGDCTRLEGYRLACDVAAEATETQVVSVADREADIYDIFVDAQQQPGRRAEFVIRARVDRSTPERDPAAGKDAYRKVREEVAGAKLLMMQTI